MTDTPDLKLCPYCGGEAHIKQVSRTGMQIKCKECGMGLKQKVLRYDLDWLKRQLIESWNQRKHTPFVGVETKE
jgi:transcription initiation factor TFIIIB Brf1 subunit/transcription initiation factor TFIIB